MGFQATESLAEEIALHLGKLVSSGQLLPKARIQEAKVASYLKVSLGSVREALLLEKRHLILNYPCLNQVSPDFKPAISRTHYLAIRSHRQELMESMSFYSGVLQFIQKRDAAAAKTVIECFAAHQKKSLCRVLNEPDCNEQQCA